MWPDRPGGTPRTDAAKSAEASELERLVEELENDWFVEKGTVVEGEGNGRATADPAPPAGPPPVVVPVPVPVAVPVDDEHDTGTIAAASAPAPSAAQVQAQQQQYWNEQAGAYQGGRKRLAAILGLVAALAVAAAVVAFIALRAYGGGSNTAAPETVSLELTPFPIGTSVDVDTRWELSGVDGDQFEATLTFVNRSSAPIAVTYQEVIPKSLANSVDDINFIGETPTTIEADPVVEYAVDVPAERRDHRLVRDRGRPRRCRPRPARQVARRPGRRVHQAQRCDRDHHDDHHRAGPAARDRAGDVGSAHHGAAGPRRRRPARNRRHHRRRRRRRARNHRPRRRRSRSRSRRRRRNRRRPRLPPV